MERKADLFSFAVNPTVTPLLLADDDHEVVSKHAINGRTLQVSKVNTNMQN